jgi:hypothetical protein
LCSEAGEHRKCKCSEIPVQHISPFATYWQWCKRRVTCRKSSKILCLFYSNYLSHVMFLGLCNVCFDVLFYSCSDWETLAWMTVVKANGNCNCLQWKRFDELTWQTFYFECAVSWCFVLLTILGNCLLQ